MRRNFVAALYALAISLICATPAPAQDSEATFLQGQIDQLASEIAGDRQQAATVQKQADQYRDLADSAERNAAQSVQQQDRESWEKTAADRRKRAEQLQLDAAGLMERASAKEGELAKLRERLAESRQSQDRREAADRKWEQDRQRHAAEAAEAPAEPPPVQQLLGVWRGADDEPLVIVQQDPGNPAYPNRLEGHSTRRVWKGHYQSAAAGDPLITLSYTPTAAEMNPDVPDWARKKVEGQLEWQLEIEAAGTCGTPVLEAQFFPGEIRWRDDGKDAPDGAWVAGRGKPREQRLTSDLPDIGFYTWGAPLLFLRLPGDFDRDTDTVDGLTKGQLFHVDVILPPELAEKQGSTLEVSIKGMDGGDTTTVELQGGAVRVGRSVVYTHYEPVTIADSNDVRVKDREPAFLSMNYFLNLTGPRLDLDAGNGEMIEFRYNDALQQVPVYNSWVQRGIAQHQDAVQRLRPFYSMVLQDPSTTREQKEGATKRLNMIRNYEAIVASDLIHDYIRNRVGDHYFRPTGGLVIHTDAQIAWAAEQAHTYIAGRLDGELSDADRDGSTNPSGIFRDVAWTSRYEKATTEAIVFNAREEYRKVALDELPKAVTYALYSAVAGMSGAGDVVTLFAGVDIFGKRVGTLERVMSAIGMASSLVLQFSTPHIMTPPTMQSAFSPGQNGARTLQAGSRVKLKEVKLAGRAASSRPAERAMAKMSPAQRDSVSPVAGEAAPSATPVSCAIARRNPGAAAAEPPDFSVPLPAHPGPIDVDLSSVKAWYGPKAEILNPGESPILPPQRFETCQCGSVMYRMKEILGKAYSELEVLSILVRIGAVKPGTNQPLSKGYTDEQLTSLLFAKGAEFMVMPASSRPTLEQVSRLMNDGWFVRDVVQTLSTAEPHAIELRGLARNSKGEITDAQWFDPAYGKEIRTSACDYVNDLVAPGYDMIFFRWKERGAPGAEAESIASPDVPSPARPSRPGTDAATADRPNPGAAAARPPGDRRQLMNEVIDEMFPNGDAPPLHTTDQQALQGIIAEGIWQSPAAGGGSFSPPGIGTLRMGDVAIRIKPGHENFVQWREHIGGLVPIFWRSGRIGEGKAATYIPTEHLQWLNPVARSWRNFEGKGR